MAKIKSGLGNGNVVVFKFNKSKMGESNIYRM